MYDRAVRLAATGLLAAAAGVALAAQQRPYPVYNEYHLDRAMKLVGRNFAGAREALDAGEFDTSKALFTRTREQIAVSITYWRHNGLDDGVRMLREVLDGLDALDAALSKPPVARMVPVDHDNHERARQAAHRIVQRRGRVQRASLAQLMDTRHAGHQF